MPFKGLYWNIRSSSRYSTMHNVYPVPDLDALLASFHSNSSGSSISIGPTATYTLGRHVMDLLMM